MIDQELIDKNERILKEIALGNLTAEGAADELVELLNETDSDYIKLVEQNAELHKELAKFRAQSFNFNSGVKCINIPSDLAM